MNEETTRKVRELWKAQAVQATGLSEEELRRRAKRSRARFRRGATLRYGAAVIAVLANCAALLFYGSPYTVAFYAVAIAAISIQLMDLPRAAVTYALRHEPLALNLGSEPPSCLDSYRKELEAQRDFARPLRVQAVFVCLFGIVLAVFGAQRTPVAVPIGTVQALAAIVWYFRARRDAPRLQSELDELLAFKRGQDTVS